jgi:protein-disulfide isomerase
MRLAAGIGGVVIVGLVVAIVMVVLNAATRSGSPRAAVSSTALVVPANATAAGAIPVGQASSPVTVEIYLDYMCPYCGRFERANGGEISRLVQSGKARVALHPLAFLDKMSAGARYSTRAANAVATVADRAPASVLAFHTALYDQQPAEGSGGLSDDQIASLATGAGVPQEVADAFARGTFEAWVTRSTEAAFASGITGTPTVKINGTVFTGDLYTVGPLTRAIEAAGSR